MTKKKENALVISQEMLAPDIYSMWLQTEAHVASDRSSV